MARIELSHVSFSYPVYEVLGRSLKVTVMRQLAGGQIASRKGFVTVDALQDLSFELKSGDRLGLIGHNGSGKSTLLRVLAGLAHPKSGTIEVEGRRITLIEKAMGINQELSGAANIELPLSLLGATIKEIEQAKRDIPEWTGLGQFMHLPVRTYSEGMKARLSFALCTAIRGEILILDEWLSAGDIGFIQQAEARLSGLVAETEIVVLATHSLDLMRRTCNKALWLDRGRMVLFGDCNTVTYAYERAMSAPPPIPVAAE